jgi:hypothetical protein
MKDYFDLVLSKFKPLIDNASYRINNPLGAAFIFSWAIINWQTVYYFLFSDQKAEAKIIYLRALYVSYNSNEHITNVDYGVLLWWPLLASIVYLLIAPIVSNLATAAWTWIDRTCSAKRVSFIEKSVFITPEERDQMYRSFAGIQTEYKNKINDLNEDIYGLRQLIILHDDKQIIENRVSEPTPPNIQNEYTPTLPASEKSILVDEDLKNELWLKSNSHSFEQWIAKTFELSVDFQPHYAEINTIKTVIAELLLNSRLPIKESSAFGVGLNKQQVESVLIKLEIKKLVTKNSDKTYSLNETGFVKLRSLINN